MPRQRSRRFLIIVLLVALVLVGLLTWPFAGAYLAAIVLACVFSPWQERLAERFRGRRRAAAGVITFAMVLIVVLPLAALIFLGVRQAARAASWVTDTLEWEGPAGLVEPLPDWLEGPALRLVQRIPDGMRPGAERREARESPPPPEATLSVAGVDDGEDAASGEEESGGAASPDTTADVLDQPAEIGAAAAAARQAITSFFALLVWLGILVVAVFFLLADGHALVDYVVELTPLEEGRLRKMLAFFREVAVGVFLSTFATAAAQTIVAAIGFVVVGMPGLPLALATVFLFSFVPAVGGAGVVVACSLLFWTKGEYWQAIVLTVWGFVVVGLVDNIVKPLVTQKSARLPGSLIFFAMLSGLALFGPLGLVAGPLIIAFFHVVANELRRSGALDA